MVHCYIRTVRNKVRFKSISIKKKKNKYIVTDLVTKQKMLCVLFACKLDQYCNVCTLSK